MRRFLSFVVIYAIWMFALHLWLDYQHPPIVEAAVNVYYIDYSATGCGGSGCSNSNNGTSKATAWKSSPQMQQGAGCAGASHSYTHVAGDQFIYRGGVTWPAACFGMNVTQGGTSQSTVSGYNQAPTINGADYYGVDVTWFAGGSFTRPIFDMVGGFASGSTFAVINSSASYVTFDDIEIAHNITEGTCGGGTMDFAGSTGITVNRMYIHDWTIYMGQANADHYSASICGGQGGGNTTLNIYNTEMSDAAQPAGSQMGTCVIYAATIAWTNCHNVAEGFMFSGSGAGVFHDDQIHDLDGNLAYTSNEVHTNTVESAYGAQPVSFYNNYLYNDNTGFSDWCPGTAIFNNVVSNQYNSQISIDDNCGGVGATTQTYVYNNTLNPNGSFGSGFASITIVSRASSSCPGGVCETGVVTLINNFSIGNGFSLTGATRTPVQSNNLLLSASVATSQGYTSSSSFAPISSNGGTVNYGTNLNASATGVLAALSLDASGTWWFGGSFKTRPANSGTGTCGGVSSTTPCWDAGAYQFQGGSTGPPSISINTPSPGNVSGSLNLTATCTPQGSATCTSVQYTIDGFIFGAAQTSSPYTLAWVTTTASNQVHVIGATATDSNHQTANAATVTVTPNNSLSGGFVNNVVNNALTPNPTTLSFTPLTSGSQQYNVTLTPNTRNTTSDNVIGFSQAPATSYSNMAAIVRFNDNGGNDGTTGTIDVYDQNFGGPLAAYTTSNHTACGTVSTCTVNLSGTNAGDVIFLGIFELAAQSVTSITDTQGNTFTLLCGPTNWTSSNLVERLYYAPNIVGGSDTITLNIASSTLLELHAYDYSNLLASPLDGSCATPATGTGTTGTSGSLTTTNANDMLFGYFHADNGATYTAGTGYTARGDLMGEDKNVSSTGTYNATMTFSPSADWVGFLVAMKSTSAGGYHAAVTQAYAAGTAYALQITPNLGPPCTYGVVETSPVSQTLASGYGCRASAPIASLGYLNSIAAYDSTPDTMLVTSFAPQSSTSLNFNPSSLPFGNVVVGATPTLSTTVTSTGGNTTFTSATVAGTGFSKTADTCSGNTVASCSITVQFSPGATGSFSGTLTLVDSASASPQVINLTGTGIASSPSQTINLSSLNLGNVLIHTSATAGPIIITVMSGPATFTGTPSFSGTNAADFALASNSCSGSVMTSCQTQVRFTPSTLTNETATISYSSSATGANSVSLTGTGVTVIPVAPSPAPFMASLPLKVPLTINGVSLGVLNATCSLSCTFPAGMPTCVCTAIQ